MLPAIDRREVAVPPSSGPASWTLRWESRVSALSPHAELLILCARIGFNP